MKINKIQYICLFLLFISCNQEQNQVIKLDKQTVLDDNEILISFPRLFTMSDSILLVCDPRTDSLFHVIDRNNNNIFSFGKKGQGPDEFLFPSSVHPYPTGDSLCLMDSNKKTFYSLKFSPENIPLLNIISTDKTNSHHDILPMKHNLYVASGIYQDTRFYLLDSKGNVIDKYVNFPNRDNNEKQLDKVVLSQAYDGYLTKDNDGSRFAIGLYNAKMIAFYKVENNKISLIKEVYDEYPEFSYYKSHYQGISSNSLTGYLSISASNNFVYALYSGKSYKEHAELASYGNLVYVYDWNGNPIKQYDLNIQACRIQISSDDKYLYAIIRSPEHEIAKFEL